MSGRFSDDGDWDDEYAALDYGRWQRNLRVAITGKRGQAALHQLRDALHALPAHRLIWGAMCTVGGVDQRLPAMTEGEFTEHMAKAAEWAARERAAGYGRYYDDSYPLRTAEAERLERDHLRQKLAEVVDGNGGQDGVCLVGAWIWHRKVQAGEDPRAAFAALPTVFTADEDGEDPSVATADLGEQAGLTYTLAWLLGEKNDTTWQDLTPEARWQAAVDWIDKQLEPAATQPAGAAS